MIKKFIKSNQQDIKKFFLFALGSIFSSIFGYLTTIEVNKGLSIIEFGKFSYYQSIFQLIFVLISLNLYSTYIRFNNNGVSESLVKIVKGYTYIAIGLFSLIIYLLTKDIFLCGFSLILIYSERTYFYRSILNTKSLNILTIVSSLISYLFCKIYFLNSLSPEHLIVLRFYGFGYAISIIFLLLSSKKNYNTNKTKISYNTLLKYCIPLIGITIIEWILNFSNQYVIKNYLGFEELAKYAMAFRALFVIRFISSIFLLYFPVVYFRDIEKNDFSKIKIFRSGILVSLFVLTIIMIIFPQIIYQIMGGDKYLESVNLFRILLIADFFRIISSFYGIVLTYELKTHKTLYIQIIGAFLNVFISIILIKKYGVTSAVIANLSACITIFVITYIYSIKIEKRHFVK